MDGRGAILWEASNGFAMGVSWLGINAGWWSAILSNHPLVCSAVQASSPFLFTTFSRVAIGYGDVLFSCLKIQPILSVSSTVLQEGLYIAI